MIDTGRPEVRGYAFPWLPVLLAMVGVAVALGVWWSLHIDEASQSRRAAQLEALHLASRIEDQAELHIAAIERMASRWEHGAGTPLHEWMADARRYIEDLPAYQAIEWVDPQFRVQWVVPLEGNEAAQGLDLRTETRRKTAGERAMTLRRTTTSQPVELRQGGKGILVFVPLYPENEFAGFILGVFRLDDWLQNTLGGGPAGYGWAVFSGEDEMYQHGPASPPMDDTLTQQASIRFRDAVWQVKVWRTAESLAADRSRLPQAALLVGLLMSVLTASVGYYAQRSSRIAQRLGHMHKDLELRVSERLEAQERLHEAHAFLDSVVENIPDMIFVKEAKGLRFVRFNRAGEDLLGYRREDLVGKNDYDFFPREQAEFFTGKDRDVLSGKALVDIPEEPVQTHDKGERILHTKKIPIMDEAGHPRYLLGISEDITDRRAAERAAEELSHALTERVKELTCLYDIARLIEQPGLDLEEILKEIVAMIPRAWEHSDTTCARIVFEGHTFASEKFIETSIEQEEAIAVSGQKVGTIQVCRTPGSSGKPEGAFLKEEALLLAAIAERIGRVVERIQTGKTLSERVADVEGLNRGMLNLLEDFQAANRRLETMTRQLEESNAELESFSYSVSHDLRAPLRAVDGFAQALTEDFGDQLDERGVRYLELVRENARNMGRLIDDLLNFSRLGRTELKTYEVNMEHLVHSVWRELLPDTDGRPVELRLQKLEPAKADPTLIHQVWTNLLANSIKFTSQAEKAVIEVGSKLDGDEIVYYVKDNGVGFDMKYVDKLFGVFSRLHAASEFKGSGVGLAIVQRIVQRHGGQVCAEGMIGEGATFFFTLPRTEGEGA